MTKQELLDHVEKYILMVQDCGLPREFEWSGVYHEVLHDKCDVLTGMTRALKLAEEVRQELEWRNKITEAVMGLGDNDKHDGDWWKQ